MKRRTTLVLYLSLFALMTFAQVWTPLNGGIDNTPTAITSNGKLIAVATVQSVDKDFRKHLISIWNGYYWQELPAIEADSTSIITSLKFYKDALYIGGKFDTIRNLAAARNIIRWKNRKYEALPQFKNAINNFNLVNEIVTYKQQLLVSGPFIANSTSVGDNVIFFNGTSIVNAPTSSFGSGISGNISTIYSNDSSMLIIGGRFTKANDTLATHIAYLQNGKWNRIVKNDVVPRGFALHNNQIYLHGTKLTTKEFGFYQVKNDGIDTINNGLEEIINITDIIAIEGRLFASGIFKVNNIQAYQSLIEYYGGSWHNVLRGDLVGIRKLLNHTKELIVSGQFQNYNFTKLNYISNYKQNVGIVAGSIFFDKDKNCKFNDRDEQLSNMNILVRPGNFIIKPGDDGSFFHVLEEGVYTLRILPNKYWSTAPCNKDSIEVKVTKGQVLSNLNFAMLQKPGIRDLSIDLKSSSGWFVQKTRNVAYTIQYQNNGSEGIAQSKVTLVKDPRLTLVKSNPSVSSAINDSLVWKFEDLYSGETRNIQCVFSINANTENDLELTASIPIEQDEEFPDDNESSLIQLLTEEEYEFRKQIYPGNMDTIALPDTAKDIEYLISFANYTNDTIRTVYVVDTIKLNHSLTYIQTTSSSHPVITKAFPGLPGEDLGIIIWTFKNINLIPNPSQSYEIVDHKGYVSFKLGLKPDLIPGNILKNRASIEFDYYEPQLTNWTYAIVSNDFIGIEELGSNTSIKLFPNPVNDVLHVGTEQQFQEFDIISINGATLSSGKLQYNAINVGHLSKGLYVLRLKGKNGITTARFVKN